MPTDDALALYDCVQRRFPLVPRPFRLIGAQVGMSEEAVLARLQQDMDAGRVSRVGAVFAPNSIGTSTLAALAVPPERLEAVAAQVSAHQEVNHNYARSGHRFNLWFVLTARTAARLEAVLACIAAETGLAPMALPLEREYHIDLGFPMSDAEVPARRRPAPVVLPELDETDWRLIEALEQGLPLEPLPYAALGRPCGLSLEEVIERIDRWGACGLIRRFGVIVRHREFGYRANAMCVWNVPDSVVDLAGERLATVPWVTLCYQRPRRPGWPYNLFAMVHGRTEVEVREACEVLHRRAGLQDWDHAVLIGTRRYKQRGARYAATV